MKTKLLVIFILIAVNTIISGISLSKITLPDGTEALAKDVKEENGKVIEAFLIQPVWIQTPAGKLEVHEKIIFHKNGKTAYCRLTQNQSIDTLVGKVKTDTVVFHENGNIFILMPSHQIITTQVGELEIFLPLSFYENGNLMEVKLYTPHTIHTPIGKLDFNSITFYKNGNIKEGYLSGSFLINTLLGEINAIFVSFFENGKIKRAYLTNPQIFDTSYGKLKLKAIAFYESGQFHGGILDTPQDFDTSIGKVTLHSFSIFENGKIRSATLFKDFTYKNKTYPALSFLIFSEDERFLGQGKWDKEKDEFEIIKD